MYLLSDVIGVDAFLRDFNAYFAKLYGGGHQNSGNPIEFWEKMIAHYEKLKIDPTTKTIIISDGHNFPKSLELLEHFQGRIKIAFGIGTNLTNDFPNEPALQIVIKVVKCNHKPVAKISDSRGKGVCKKYRYLAYLKQVFKVE